MGKRGFFMKTALVLGGTQFVGKRLVELMIQEGMKVLLAKV